MNIPYTPPTFGADGFNCPYCHAFANAAFGCRSTGGGKNNRKVCLP